MSTLLSPYGFYASVPHRYEKIAYTEGPTGSTGLYNGLFRYGLPLNSGEFYTQRWGLWGDQNNSFYMVPLDEQLSVKTQTTGWRINHLFPLINLNTSSAKRFASFSFCFNSSGIPYFAIEDEGDANVGFYPEPLIRVAYSGGGMMKSWNGHSPVMFNMAQVNYPYAVPSRNYPIFRTGEIVCFYFKNSGESIYIRTESSNFETGYLLNTGLTAGYFATRRMERNIKNFRSGEYWPHKNVMYVASPDESVIKVITSKSHINYATDNFEKMATGFFYGLFLTKGYGKWIKYSEYSDTSGQALDFNVWYSDNFEKYETGRDQYYLSLPLTFVNISGVTGVVQNAGQTFIYGVFQIENFESYETGFSTIFRNQITNIDWTGSYTGRVIPNAFDEQVYHLCDFELLPTGSGYVEAFNISSYNVSTKRNAYLFTTGFPQIIIISSGYPLLY